MGRVRGSVLSRGRTRDVTAQLTRMVVVWGR